MFVNRITSNLHLLETKLFQTAYMSSINNNYSDMFLRREIVNQNSCGVYI